MAEKDFSVEEFDAMFDAAVGRGLLQIQECSKEEGEVEKIKHLVKEIASGETDGWKKLFDLLIDEPEFSVEGFNDVFSLVLDALPHPPEVTIMALDTLHFLLAMSPVLFQPSPQQLDKMVPILSKEILECGVGSDNFFKKDSSLSCFCAVMNKFSCMAALRVTVTRLFAKLSGQFELYDCMHSWLSSLVETNRVDDNNVVAPTGYITEFPLLFYMSMLAALNLNGSIDAHMKITAKYELSFDRVKFWNEWKHLQEKDLGYHFLDFVKGILFGSVVLPPFHVIGPMIVGELAVLLLPKGEWEDLEYFLRIYLELNDFETNNEMLLIIETIMKKGSFGMEGIQERFINELFPAVFKKLKTHLLATSVILLMMSRQPSCVEVIGPRLMMRKLAKWIRGDIETPTPALTTTAEMEKCNTVRFLLAQLIKAEEKVGDSDPILLEEMKRLAL